MSNITEIQIPSNLILLKIKYYIKYFNSSSLITDNSIITYNTNSNYDSSFKSAYPTINDSFFQIKINLIKKIVCNDNIIHILTNNGLLYSMGNDYQNYGILGMGDLVYEIKDLTLNNFFLNCRLKNISICDKYCICLDSISNIIIFGTFNNFIYKFPKLIKNTNQIYFNEVKCNNNYFALLDYNGYLNYYGYILKKYYKKDENIIPKIIEFDYKNEIIDDFICLNNYICILSKRKKVFLYNESGLFKFQIKDLIENIYQMKNSIFLFSNDNKKIYVLENNKNENNFNARVYKINENFKLLRIINNYIDNPKEIIFLIKSNCFLNPDNIFTLTHSFNSNKNNNFFTKRNINLDDKLPQNLSDIQIEKKLNLSLKQLNKNPLNKSNSIYHDSRINRISHFLERIFDSKINEIQRKRSTSINKKINLEKINTTDSDFHKYKNKMIRSYSNSVFKINDNLGVEEEIIKNNNLLEETNKENKEEILNMNSIKINMNDNLQEKKILTFKFDNPDKKLIINQTKNLSLNSIIQLNKINIEKKKELCLIQQKQKENEEEIKKLKEIQKNQQKEILLIKKNNEEKDKEISRLRYSEFEKELEIQKKNEKIKNLKNTQKRREEFLNISNKENQFITPKNPHNNTSINLFKSLSQNSKNPSSIEDNLNNFLLNSNSHLNTTRKKNNNLIRSYSQVFLPENKNLKLINKNQKIHSDTININSIFNSFKNQQNNKTYKGKKIITVPSKEILFDILKNNVHNNSLDKSFYFQIQNEKDSILKYKNNQVEIIKLKDEIINNLKNGKTARINRVNSMTNYISHRTKKNSPIKLSNSIVLNSSIKNKKNPSDSNNVLSLKKNKKKERIIERSHSLNKFLYNINDNKENNKKFISHKNDNKKSYERSITPLKLISQKSSFYVPSNQKNNFEKKNINIDKLTNKYLNYIKKKYGNDFFEDNIKNKSFYSKENEIIKDFMNNEIINNKESDNLKINFSSINELEKFINEHLKFENIKNKLKGIDNNLIVDYIPNELIKYEEEEKNFDLFEPIELDFSLSKNKD